MSPVCRRCQSGWFPDGSKNADAQKREAENMLGQCRLKPPQLIFFMTPPRVQGGPPEPHYEAQWPFVMKDQFCTQDFKLKPGALS